MPTANWDMTLGANAPHWPLAARGRADLYEARSLDGDTLRSIAATLFGVNVDSCPPAPPARLTSACRSPNMECVRKQRRLGMTETPKGLESPLTLSNSDQVVVGVTGPFRRGTHYGPRNYKLKDGLGMTFR
jgi:hypothetical protein